MHCHYFSIRPPSSYIFYPPPPPHHWSPSINPLFIPLFLLLKLTSGEACIAPCIGPTQRWTMHLLVELLPALRAELKIYYPSLHVTHSEEVETCHWTHLVLPALFPMEQQLWHEFVLLLTAKDTVHDFNFLIRLRGLCSANKDHVDFLSNACFSLNLNSWPPSI